MFNCLRTHESKQEMELKAIKLAAIENEALKQRIKNNKKKGLQVLSTTKQTQFSNN